MLLIAPRHNKAHLVQVIGGNLAFLRELTVDYRTPFHRWERDLVYIDRAEQALRHVVVEGAGAERNWPLPISLDIYGRRLSLAVVGNRAYVAGSNQTTAEPLLFTLPLDDERGEWSNCYPDELVQRKEIDALVVSGKRLIAVDNVIYPKYLFFIDEADQRVGPATVLDLPCHGTYEGILDAIMYKNSLATLSTTMGMGGGGTHVSVLDPHTFKEKGYVSAYSPPEMVGGPDDRDHIGVGYALRSVLLNTRALGAGADRLVVACGQAGLVILHPDRITSGIDTGAFDDEVRLRSIACHLSMNQLPLHQLPSTADAGKPEMVTDVLSGGNEGCVAVVRFSEGLHESLLLPKELLMTIMP